MPRAVLLKLLEGLNTPAATTTTTTTTSTTTLTANNEEKNESTNFLTSHTKLPTTNQPQLGIGLDSCVIPLRHSGLSLIQTTDFFYPLIEDVRIRI